MCNDYIYVYMCYICVCGYKNVILHIDIQHIHVCIKINKLLYYIGYIHNI